jgi:polyferredoxin/Tfp pilus assembly protein PilF
VKRRCDVGVELAQPSLPVAGTGSLSGVRKSRHARWRALVLGAVHLLILVHATHFLVAGRTLSPVEPSESMYTLELGQINAGFIFFCLALLSTLLFGRFFCGWGCHIVALQDLCGWLMKRLGVRPRPFRSRLLVYAPLVVALYMFVLPAARRLLWPASTEAFPGFSNHLITTGFWDTFPGPVHAVLTFLICGFAAVYLLGAKGFCTYGCPYGALFGIADRFAPGRILVTDACDQCGHCTATCTSNVRVHDEVRRFGMVVDPGCMKCTDCISVCPKGALYFGFAAPTFLRRRGRRTRDAGRGAGASSLDWRQETVAAFVMLGATLAFRGLYDGPPLLMSVGLGGITAFLVLKLASLAARRDVRLQSLRLRTAEGITPAGKVFAAVVVLWSLFTAHSGFVQWHRFMGRAALNRTEANRADVLAGTSVGRAYSRAHDRAVESMMRHFGLADRFGFADTVEVKLGLAWGHLLRQDAAGAEARIREALDAAPEHGGAWQSLFEVSMLRGDKTRAIEALRTRMALAGASAQDLFLLAGLLVETGSLDAAVGSYEACLEQVPGWAEARYNLGGVLRRLGRNAEAIDQLERARERMPGDRDVHVELGLAYAAVERDDEALAALGRAIELDPDNPESRLHLPSLIREISARRSPPAHAAPKDGP